jgi:hypothetical protein
LALASSSITLYKSLFTVRNHHIQVLACQRYLKTFKFLLFNNTPAYLTMVSFVQIMKLALLCAFSPLALLTTIVARGATTFARPKALAVLIIATQVPLASSCMVNSPIKTSIITDTDVEKTNIGVESVDTSTSTDLAVGKHRWEHHSESREMHVGVETTVLSFIVVATILLVLVIGSCSAWVYTRYSALNDAVTVTSSSPPNYS